MRYKVITVSCPRIILNIFKIFKLSLHGLYCLLGGLVTLPFLYELFLMSLLYVIVCWFTSYIHVIINHQTGFVLINVFFVCNFTKFSFVTKANSYAVAQCYWLLIQALLVYFIIHSNCYEIQKNFQTALNFYSIFCLVFHLFLIPTGLYIVCIYMLQNTLK